MDKYRVTAMIQGKQKHHYYERGSGDDNAISGFKNKYGDELISVERKYAGKVGWITIHEKEVN